jgi:peroxiredoxin
MSRTSPPRPKPKVERSAWRWIGFIAPLAVLAVLVAIAAASGPTNQSVETLGTATPFTLSATDGTEVSLEETLGKGDTLLYFSMGVGCDGCFAQIPEIEAGAVERGLNVLPIMVDPAPMVTSEAARFGIESPILIDSGARVSVAYGMVGVYGHNDRPSHSFALVRPDGTIPWVRHYAEMFVPSDAFFEELDNALGE